MASAAVLKSAVQYVATTAVGMLDEAEKGSIPTTVAEAIDPNRAILDQKRGVVNQRINQIEADERKQYEDGCSSVLYLYGHWFMSLLCLFEVLFHMMILTFVCFFYIVVASLLYYIILVFSCGKVSISYCENVTHYLKMCGLYWGIWLGLLCNIVAPWDPPLYFWKKGRKLNRPSGSGPNSTSYHSSRDCCCFTALCCCGEINSIPGMPPDLPLWLMLQSCLMVVGCCNFCGSLYCGPSAYHKAINKVNDREKAVVFTHTQEFYLTNYNVESFEQLIQYS